MHAHMLEALRYYVRYAIQTVRKRPARHLVLTVVAALHALLGSVRPD